MILNEIMWLLWYFFLWLLDIFELRWFFACSWPYTANNFSVKYEHTWKAIHVRSSGSLTLLVACTYNQKNTQTSHCSHSSFSDSPFRYLSWTTDSYLDVRTIVIVTLFLRTGNSPLCFYLGKLRKSFWLKIWHVCSDSLAEVVLFAADIIFSSPRLADLGG